MQYPLCVGSLQSTVCYAISFVFCFILTLNLRHCLFLLRDQYVILTDSRRRLSSNMSLTAFYSVCAPVAICIVQLSPVSSLSIITVASDSRAYLSAHTSAPAPPDMPYVSCRSTYRIFSSLSRLLACAHLLFLNPCHSALSCVYLAHTPLYRAYCAHVSSYAYVMRVRVS